MERYEDSYLYRLRHSAAHLMAQAVSELYPGARLTIGLESPQGLLGAQLRLDGVDRALGLQRLTLRDLHLLLERLQARLVQRRRLGAGGYGAGGEQTGGEEGGAGHARQTRIFAGRCASARTAAAAPLFFHGF